jgi:hypothetical protein
MPVTDENTILLEQIDSLLAVADAEEPEVFLARAEDTLSAGYARALALEAERWRLERQLGALAAGLADGDSGTGTEELSTLARRMAVADGKVTRLRRRLASLRERARLVRAA